MYNEIGVLDSACYERGSVFGLLYTLLVVTFTSLRLLIVYRSLIFSYLVKGISCIAFRTRMNRICSDFSTLLLNSIQMWNGYRKNSLCLRAASTLKWSVFSQFFTELPS